MVSNHKVFSDLQVDLMTACRSFQHERSYTWKPKALASWRAYRRISLVWCGNVHRGCHNLRFHLDRVVSLSCWVFDFISHFDFPLVQGVGAASPRRNLRNLVIDQRFRGRRSQRPNQFCWKTRRPACLRTCASNVCMFDPKLARPLIRRTRVCNICLCM